MFLKEELVEYKKCQENKILFNELKKNKPFKILNISNIFNNVEKENLSSYNINYDLSYMSNIKKNPYKR